MGDAGEAAEDGPDETPEAAEAAGAAEATGAADGPLPERRQVAALCWRGDGAGGREVLLVTSSHGRWILPKGWPMTGRSDGEAALVEAWEEAGVRRAILDPRPLGGFIVTKTDRHGRILRLPARVFACEVTELAGDWPEKHRRSRRWLPPAAAADVVREDDLRALLRAF